MQSSYSAVHVPYLTRLDSHQRSWSTFNHKYELPFTVELWFVYSPNISGSWEAISARAHHAISKHAQLHRTCL